jgi:hypothetical protein
MTKKTRNEENLGSADNNPSIKKNPQHLMNGQDEKGIYEISMMYRCNDGNTGEEITVLRELSFVDSAKIQGRIGKDLVKVRVKIKKEWDFPELKTFLELFCLYVKCKEKLIALPEKTAKTLQDCLKTVLEKVKEDVFDIDNLPDEIEEAIANIRDIKLVYISTPDEEYSLNPSSHS